MVRGAVVAFSCAALGLLAWLACRDVARAPAVPSERGGVSAPGAAAELEPLDPSLPAASDAPLAQVSARESTREVVASTTVHGSEGVRVVARLVGADGRPWALADFELTVSLWIERAGGTRPVFWSGLNEASGARFWFDGVDLERASALRLDIEGLDDVAFTVTAWSVRHGVVDLGDLALPASLVRVELRVVDASGRPIPGAAATAGAGAHPAILRDARWTAGADGCIRIALHDGRPSSVRVAAPEFAVRVIELEPAAPERRVVLVRGTALRLALVLPDGAERLQLLLRAIPSDDALAAGAVAVETDFVRGELRLEPLAVDVDYRLELGGDGWFGLPLELGAVRTGQIEDPEPTALDLTRLVELTTVSVFEPAVEGEGAAEEEGESITADGRSFRLLRSGPVGTVRAYFELVAEDGSTVSGGGRVTVLHRPRAPARIDAAGFQSVPVQLVPPHVDVTLERAPRVAVRFIDWYETMEAPLHVEFSAIPADGGRTFGPWHGWVLDDRPDFEFPIPRAGEWTLRFEVRPDDEALLSTDDWPLVFERRVYVSPQAPVAIDVAVPADVLARLR